MTSPIFARYDDNTLVGAAISGTAPLSTYSLTTLAHLNPSQRVRFGSGTVTITFTVSARRGDLLVIPMHNLDAGAAVLALTNNVGFGQSITVPAYQSNGFPPTLVADLTLLAGNRTPTAWNLVITGNSANVQFGGAVGIYQKRTFAELSPSEGFSLSYRELEMANMIETANEYGSPYVQDYETVSRQIEVTVCGYATQIAAAKEWFRAGHGRVFPSFFWPEPSVLTGAYFGRWQKTFEVQSKENYYELKVLLDEWPKGKPIV